jgi:hypothetical protein
MLGALVESAFEYAYPLYAMAQTRYRALQDPFNAVRHAPNTLQHERRLSDADARWITAPNNDTLYSNAWLDLSSGPVRIGAARMPPGRYWSIAFMDAFTNNFAVLGQRLEGEGPVEVTLVGPRDHATEISGRVIRAPGHDVWMFCRCLVVGPEDLPNSHAMQDRLEVVRPGGVSVVPRVAPTQSTDAENFLAVVNESLAHNGVPSTELSLLERWAVVGLRPGAVDVWNDLSEESRSAWNARIGAAHDKLRRASATGRREIHGWFASATDMGDFGTNYALRASVALGGLGALPPAEAMYFVRFHDDDKQLLDGRHRYLLRVGPSGIPTDSFWSFTMYEPTADGQRFLVANPIGRYSIGNRTRRLVANVDGSLDIALQSEAPAEEGLRANWLPAPAGPFQISLRAYSPRAELRDLRACMPRIVRS